MYFGISLELIEGLKYNSNHTVKLMTDQYIQWFPGHMHKAAKEIRKRFSQVNVFIELLDSRIPYSSSNPLLEDIRGEKPCVKVMTKSDLSDPALNKLWKTHFECDQNSRVLQVDTRKRSQLLNIPSLCQKLYAATGAKRQRITAMVMGIPNVGKSTLINGLAGKAIAKTGNEPAITKQQQLIEINDQFLLMDTPGLMWPKVENFHSGYRLAITGAIRDTALSHQEVALFALGALRELYPNQLLDRYKLRSLEDKNLEILKEIGQKRGCLIKGGEVDLDRASKILITDIREGRLGRLTWETPEMIKEELARSREQN